MQILPPLRYTPNMSQELKTADENLRLTFFDEGNPLSLVNKVWAELRQPMEQVAKIYAKEFLFHEAQIKAFCKPDERDIRARLCFWDEYALACAADRPMRKECVLGEVTPEIWRKVYLRNYRKLLFVLHQPSSYATSMRRLLDIGIDRLYEIMDMPIIRNGLPDHKAVANILKAFQLVDLRVKGAVVQRLQIDQRSLNVNQNIDVSNTERQLAFMSMQELESMKTKLAEIEAKRAVVVESLPPSVALHDPLDAITKSERELYAEELGAEYVDEAEADSGPSEAGYLDDEDEQDEVYPSSDSIEGDR